MNRFFLLIKPFTPAFLSGLLMGTSYIPFFPWAIFFCLVPIWLELSTSENLTYKSVFLKTWVFQFVLTLVGFHWISFVAHEFGFLPWWLAFIVLLLFAAFIHIYFPLAALLAHYLKNKFNLKPWAYLLNLALLTSLGEILFPIIFKWNFGYALFYAHIPAFQTAQYMGFLGLSLFILLTQALIVIIIKSSQKKLKYLLSSAIFLFWLILNGSGYLIEQNIKNSAYQLSHIGIIQANIGNLEKYYSEKGLGFQKKIIDTYTDMSLELINKQKQSSKPLDFLIWPEAAIPDYLDTFHEDRKNARYFHQKLKTLGVALATGGFSSDPKDELPRKDYNGFFIFNPDGSSAAPAYRKTQLLIFGEYLPFSETFPELKKYNPAGSGFSRGQGPEVFNFQGLKVGAQICYESLDPRFTAKLGQKKAELILNVTNDSWFGPRSEPQQHLYMTLARTIESRIPLVRATNTGISAAIDSAGEIYGLSPQGEPWSEVIELKRYPSNGPTVYTQYGALLPFLVMMALILILILGQKNTQKNISNPHESPNLD